MDQGGRFIGWTTNNLAEYSALILGLEKALQLKVSKLVCFSDSELMIRQLNGIYRVKDPDLKNCYLKVKKLTGSFDQVSFLSVPREKNLLADKLVNKAIDSSHPRKPPL